MTKHLLRDLGEFTDNLLRLTAAVEEALADALNAILARDPELARRVVAGDREIDRLEVRLEEDALKILALHAPVARDLRYLVAAIKIDNDLERIADMAANIARRAVELAAYQPVQPPAGIEEMAARTRQMVRQAIHALVNRDPGLAQQVREEDDAVDDLNRAMLQELEERLKAGGPGQVEPLLRWFGVVRNLERVADLATNIAEDVLYLIEGEIVRHR
ncbi:MAG: phosphate signaling complex protein PhoU [Planctomycetes bacterium]|nr:phosphate signaling complex protein PhoU [Planctomycetota bacterium]MBL7008535.1 phosphate signaling complex protein PhoU [Planctomycetota bacterium]